MKPKQPLSAGDEQRKSRRSVLAHRDESRKYSSTTLHRRDTYVTVDLDADNTHHYHAAQVASKAFASASKGSIVLDQAKLGDIALVKFNELETGEFLGKGSFSNVHEITKVALSQAESTADNEDDPECDPDPRAFLAQNYQRESNNSYRYAVKYLRDDVAADADLYRVGSADLIVEGMFLASLSHPNIIQIRGLPENGIKSISRGLGYFLILD